MAKFPTEVERSVTVRAPIDRVYAYLWDVVGSSECIEGLDHCKRVAEDTYRFRYQERSAGPVSMMVCYTVRYQGNGKDRITFECTDAKGDNTEARGSIRLESKGENATRVLLRQMVAPETPIPRLVQGLIKSFVEREAAEEVRRYLANIKRVIEEKG